MLLSLQEVEEKLSVGRTLARSLVRSGELPSVRLGRCVRVRMADLTAYVERLPVRGNGANARAREAVPANGFGRGKERPKRGPVGGDAAGAAGGAVSGSGTAGRRSKGRPARRRGV